MKLSQRLTQLENMVDGRYAHIWDCCCDHGLLGAALLKRQAAPTIHFVDIVPDIMQGLTDKLRRFYPPRPDNADWQVHCMDVAKLPLDDYVTDAPHLVIIAGVGGELTYELVSAIQQKADTLGQKIEFLLCPVHHTYQLRERLNALGLKRFDERLISENKRCYELLHLARQAEHPITAIGDRLWSSAPMAIQQTYLTRLLTHYTQVLRGENPIEQRQLLSRAIQDYQAQLNQLGI
ncbi:tRNA (adenine(22)-N(1))-methyltransferase [Shewanella marisflavi]|uniref:tRNA (adenine(22)-N(1))-methyltransferase n=1 Tax=Shewanella marisflavi TaxID=260364 RepID=UPI003AABE710